MSKTYGEKLLRKMELHLRVLLRKNDGQKMKMIVYMCRSTSAKPADKPSRKQKTFQVLLKNTLENQQTLSFVRIIVM